MNEDKELEEAIKTLKIVASKSDEPFKFAIKTVLQALENSIPKKKIEDKIKIYKNMCARLGLAIDKETFNMFDNKIKVLQELLEDK